MQIIIPMSGFGERFRKAGYTVPKPLIMVDGKPIIAHVVDMFPGEQNLIFICNKDHLAEPSFRMEQIIREACPTAQIVAVAPHREGPIHAVMQAEHLIDPDRPVVVNYCDFTCFWDWADFKSFVAETRCDGAIPAYKGFHPHSLGSTRYAYVREKGLWADKIQEKTPFTANPLEEFASSGTYYFSSGATMLEAFRETIAQDLRVNGEFYVSMAFQPLMDQHRPVAVYQLQHFMQWGTPDDLKDYTRWSAMFRCFTDSARSRTGGHSGTLLIPMAGLGSRFTAEGYDLPKPLIEVGGLPMVVRAALDMPHTDSTLFVTRQDLPRNSEVMETVKRVLPEADILVLDGATDGQARTSLLGAQTCPLVLPLSIAPCDSGALFAAAAFADAFASADVLVWGVRGHSAAALKPTSYSWIDAEDNGTVRRVALKTPLSDPQTDPIVIGTFTFKKAKYFVDAAEALIHSGETINGEYYADAVINKAIDAGLNVRMFEIEHYIGWGTPDEYRTFCYWQSCFHKWNSHPYRLEHDARVEATSRDALAKEYETVRPERPATQQ